MLNAEHMANLGFLSALSSGRKSEGIEILKQAIQLAEDNVRLPFMNYLGIAYFHNREFAKAAETIERNRDRGGPMGPHMYAYLAAAHAMAGNEGHARAFAERFRTGSSDFSVKNFIEYLIQDAEERQLIFKALERSGLEPSSL